MLKLTIELVPSTSWCSNVRTKVSRSRWDKIRKKSYENAGHVCEICGGVGPRHPVECHEIWEYDVDRSTQTLVGLIALCPKCHQVKHAGLASVKGKLHEVYAHLIKVNGISKEEAIKIVEEAFETYRFRSSFNWRVDISYISKYLGE